MDRVAARKRVSRQGLMARLRFPLAAYAVWRLAQLGVLAAVGGQHRGTLFKGDGDWYHRLWLEGYGAKLSFTDERVTNFFPALSWITKAVRTVTPSDEVAANLVVTIFGVTAVCAIYLAVAEWRGGRVARTAVLLLLAAPASMFLHRFYTEGLFLTLSASALLAHTRKRPVVAAALCGLAVMTRVPGVALVGVLIASACIEDRRWTRRSAVYLCAVAGLAPVLVAQWLQAGSPFDFVSASAAWGRHLAGPWVPFVDGYRAWRSGGAHSETVVFDLVAVAVFAWLTVLAFVRRWPWSARLLMVAMIAIPMTQNFVTSLGRYMLAAWPGVGVAAEWLETRTLPFRVGVFVLLVLASVLFLRLSSLGAFVG
jgi:hypothetical protein